MAGGEWQSIWVSVGPGQRSQYSDWLRAGWSRVRIPVGGGAKFSSPVQTGPGAHPASCTMGTRSFPWDKAAGAWRWPPTTSSNEVKERVQLYLYPHLWAFVACYRVNFTFTFTWVSVTSHCFKPSHQLTKIFWLPSVHMWENFVPWCCISKRDIQN